ncbi:hypothetical protein B5807_06594 [Epicoccum nigrum]|uniref:Uncharacterized protein n=1 Tax=Epicoccum nigrum TaxID=105696 RepID=A0A1Y2LWH4_EPING|nr:hypothetical protein B5807_06594 [Epicoccum nigrum]
MKYLAQGKDALAFAFYERRRAAVVSASSKASIADSRAGHSSTASGGKRPTLPPNKRSVRPSPAPAVSIEHPSSPSFSPQSEQGKLDGTVPAPSTNTRTSLLNTPFTPPSPPSPLNPTSTGIAVDTEDHPSTHPISRNEQRRLSGKNPFLSPPLPPRPDTLADSQRVTRKALEGTPRLPPSSAAQPHPPTPSGKNPKPDSLAAYAADLQSLLERRSGGSSPPLSSSPLPSLSSPGSPPPPPPLRLMASPEGREKILRGWRGAGLTRVGAGAVGRVGGMGAVWCGGVVVWM